MTHWLPIINYTTMIKFIKTCETNFAMWILISLHTEGHTNTNIHGQKNPAKIGKMVFLTGILTDSCSIIFQLYSVIWESLWTI